MREIVLDTETTGLDPKSGDRVVEIGCIELVNHIPSGKSWHEYMNPEREMPLAAFEVHGLSTEFLSDKPLFADLVDGFLEFIEDATLVIHNASFDIGFLNFELKRLKRSPISMDRVIDTLVLARRKHPGAQNNLDALCRRYQIDNTARTKHGALLDSEILAQVYAELIGGRQANLALSKQGKKNHQNKSCHAHTIQRIEPLVQRLTTAETGQHRSFVDQLSDSPLWKDYLED